MPRQILVILNGPTNLTCHPERTHWRGYPAVSKDLWFPRLTRQRLFADAQNDQHWMCCSPLPVRIGTVARRDAQEPRRPGIPHRPGRRAIHHALNTLVSFGRSASSQVKGMIAVGSSTSGQPGVLQRLSLAVNPAFRKAILSATHQPLVARGVRRYGMRLGAARFVAGESFEEAVPVLRSLNQRGMRTNTTLLGEGVNDATEAAAVVDTYNNLLDIIAREGLQTNIALKLTHLGLDLGEDVAFQHVERVVQHAAECNNFIRIDMEESARVDPTLRIYRRLREAGHDNVGTVLQSMLFRTARDLEELLPLKPNLRLVKGAYLEPANVAYSQKQDVDRNYVQLAERMLSAGNFTAIATHDERIINHVIDFAATHGIGTDQYEFQMLYGIRPQLQQSLVERGYRVLIATPFGREWYFYLMRRLAERPANLLFVARGVFERPKARAGVQSES